MSDPAIEWQKRFKQETDEEFRFLREDVIKTIDDFCTEQGISTARFSLLATGDRGFYSRLKASKAAVGMRLMARIDAFIKVGLPPGEAPAQKNGVPRTRGDEPGSETHHRPHG